MTPAVVGAIAGVVVLLALSGRRSARPRDRGAEVVQHTTASYARGKVRTLAARLRDPAIRAAVERWFGRWTPGLPTEAAVALGASSMGAREQLNTPPGAWGLWGVEPSYLDRHGADATTVADLGRAVTRATYPGDIEAQAYLGARRYHDALASARRLGADVDGAEWGPWEMQAAVCVYSAGEARLAELLRLAPIAARHDPRGQRWTRIAEDTYPQVARGQSRRLAWALVRPRERYASALALARAVGAPLSWYTDVDLWEPSADAELSALAHERRE